MSKIRSKAENRTISIIAIIIFVISIILVIASVIWIMNLYKENDRLNCKNIISEFEEYYSKDNGLSYFKCDGNNEGDIQYCKKCNYNNDELICIECKDNYVLKDDEKKVCYSKGDFENDKKYYYEDSLHIKTCSNRINNCEECEKIDNNIKCTKCKNGYYFVNEDYYNCKSTGEINPINEYYLENGEYYSCGDIKYNSIENCKECDNKNSCNLCKNGYTFIDDAQSSCNNIEQLGNQYVVDSSNNKIYRKCDHYMDNCILASPKMNVHHVSQHMAYIMTK
jgi:hypothetical protein